MIRKGSASKRHKNETKRLQVLRALSFHRLLQLRKSSNQHISFRKILLLFNFRKQTAFIQLISTTKATSLSTHSRKIIQLNILLNKTEKLRVFSSLKEKFINGNFLRKIFNKHLNNLELPLKVVFDRMRYFSIVVHKHEWIIGNFVS